jgi:hypothetical protein
MFKFTLNLQLRESSGSIKKILITIYCFKSERTMDLDFLHLNSLSCPTIGKKL